MLISNITPSLTTAIAFFAPAAAAWDMKVKWQDTTTCVDPGGPARTYVRDDCMPLTNSDHGVKILDHVTPCNSKNLKFPSRDVNSTRC
ncbi:hypothetical protein PG997_007230 [Apiospora hydei]|uniref:Uncharacterized protein n=1 Tax=Apiospora hydei TaxID=1337664 RepID=A0ABR1W7F4_9PEZI